jgi:hypothetical protein
LRGFEAEIDMAGRGEKVHMIDASLQDFLPSIVFIRYPGNGSQVVRPVVIVAVEGGLVAKRVAAGFLAVPIDAQGGEQIVHADGFFVEDMMLQYRDGCP